MSGDHEKSDEHNNGCCWKLSDVSSGSMHESVRSKRSERTRRKRPFSEAERGVDGVKRTGEDDHMFPQVHQRDDISLHTLTQQFVLEIKRQHGCLLMHLNKPIISLTSCFCAEQVPWI